MKNIWILTTGSSDVQFTADDDKWNRLYRKVRNQINTSHKFSPTPRPNDDTGEAFLVPARVMGMVYEEQLEENYADLYFPLLDAFSQKLQSENTPNRIIVILTDQEQVFTAQERKERNRPYWQDTCKLIPIIEKYLKQPDKFPGAELEYIYLKPQSKEEGLDNWDKALALVQKELSKIKADANDKIYVSHQASTPAISSAVQFVSLAKFGKQVQFLVSNEYEKKPLDLIDSSEYLRGIQIQEAKALLKRYDYEGVKDLLSPYWKEPLTPLEQKISELLEMAIQWNRAEFKKFMDLAKDKIEGAKERIDEPWAWWTAYESAYLAVVRLEQDNTVEAMFHSFRAVEGLLAKWVDEYDQVEKQGKKITKQEKKIKFSHKIVAPWNNKKTTDTVNAYNQGLYFTLEFFKGVDKNKDTEFDIWTFGNYVFNIRNSLFHNLEGLKDKEAVFKAWEISSDDEQERKDKIEQKQKDDEMEQKWKDRVLGCLNFIAEPNPPFTSVEEASLMSQVHEKLENALASYL